MGAKKRCGEFSAMSTVSGADGELCRKKRLHHVSKTSVDSSELQEIGENSPNGIRGKDSMR
jgi:hypothetical protein